jgi:hypothetical protein
MPSDVSASAREIGVLEDLTITSATSARGIVRRRVRGGVVSDVVEVPAAENILDMSTRSDDFHHEEMYSHPDTFRYAFQPAERTPPLELLLLSSSRHVDLESSIDRSPKSRQRTFGQFTPFLDLPISQIPPLKG